MSHQFKAQLKSIEIALPEKVLTNIELSERFPQWNMQNVEIRSGVFKRHVAGELETAFDLSLIAAKKLIQKNNIDRNLIDGIIYCTQSPDYIMPPNSYLLHKGLELRESVFAYDFNMACSGFIYAIAMAESWIKCSFAKNILVVTADTYSKYINEADRSTRTLFGDGATACLFSGESTASGLIDVIWGTSGSEYNKFWIPAGGNRSSLLNSDLRTEEDKSGNLKSVKDIHMDGMGILTFVTKRVPSQVKELLSRNNLTINDIDFFVFHQASQMALDTLSKNLEIPKDRMIYNLKEIGNTVSSSIPMALKCCLDEGKIQPGQKVILSGFGVGLSWASALYQF